MLNTIKMDFYRMMKSKSSYIILLVLFAITIFNTSLTGLMRMQISNNGDVIERFNVLSEAFRFSSNAGVLLFLSIFTVIYSSSMYKTGYIKNIVGKVNYRVDLLISNIVIILIYSVAVFLTVFIAMTIGGFIGYETVEFIGFKGFLVGTILQYILVVSLMMGVLLLVTLLKKSGGVMAIAIIYVNGMGLLFWNLLNAVIEKYISKSIEIMDYSVICSISKVDMTTRINFDNYWKILIVGLVWASIFIISSVFVMNKKDIA